MLAGIIQKKINVGCFTFILTRAPQFIHDQYIYIFQVECNKGPKSDKEGFAKWVSELSQAFKPKGWLLSAAVSPSKKVIDLGYDVPSMARDLDWIAVM